MAGLQLGVHHVAWFWPPQVPLLDAGIDQLKSLEKRAIAARGRSV